MRVSRNTNELISGFGSSCKSKYSGWSMAFSLPPFFVYLYTCSGRPAMASASILTQEYTAVICIADRSVTVLPAVVPPM